MIRLEPITDTQSFSCLQDEWNQILAHSGSDNIHLSHEWLSAWWDTFGNNFQLLVLRVLKNRTTIGFVPLMISNTRIRGILPYKRISFLADPMTDFGDFILIDCRREALDAIFRFLGQSKSWGELHLKNIPEISPNLPDLSKITTHFDCRFEFINSAQCYYVSMINRNWEDYEKSLGKEFVRRGVARRKKYYDNLEWKIEEIENENINDSVYESIRYLHQSSQHRMGRASMYGVSEFRTFFNRIVIKFLPRGIMKIYFLTVAGKRIAFMLGFEYNQIFYWWNTGFDTQYEKLAPSKILMWNVFKRGFEYQRWKEFNFMHGASEYKSHWSSTYYNLYKFRMLNQKGMYGILNSFRGQK